MKIKILGQFNYQTFPIVDGMVDVNDEELEQIGLTRQFDVEKQSIIFYDNSMEIEAQQRYKRIEEIKTRLNQLSEDIIQYQAGEDVPNIIERKAEFISLHNELRELENKSPRSVRV